MPDAAEIVTRTVNEVYKTLENAVAVGEAQQHADGRASVFGGLSAASAAANEKFKLGGTPSGSGQFNFTKPTGIVFLAGGEVWWDHSANTTSFKRNGDRDFYLGTAYADATTDAILVTVDLNAQANYAIDLMRGDPFTTAIVGTQALGGLGLYQRGGLSVILDATNEAQKVDALSVQSFANNANGIIEIIFRVPSDGAGTVVDVSVGVASATHATDASSITQRLFMHLDANATDIRFESADGTTTVAITDSTTDYTEGATLTVQKHVWFDMRTTSSVVVYVDGVRVLSGTTFNVAAAASEWKLLLHVEKTASTDTYEFALDRLRVRTSEQ